MKGINARKLKLSPELSLYLKHPDFAAIVAEIYWEWAMYGMFLAEFCRTEKWATIQDEFSWLEQQYEAGIETARYYARQSITRS